jgi:hypothetical protein
MLALFGATVCWQSRAGNDIPHSQRMPLAPKKRFRRVPREYQPISSCDSRADGWLIH